MTSFAKLLFVLAAASASAYSMSVFGPGMWSWIFLGITFLVLVSVFVASLDVFAIILGCVSGVLAGLALALLMLAATVGGSFNMSDSNVVFAVLLVFLMIFGFTAFFWENRLNKESQDKLQTTDNSNISS